MKSGDLLVRRQEGLGSSKASHEFHHSGHILLQRDAFLMPVYFFHINLFQNRNFLKRTSEINTSKYRLPFFVKKTILLPNFLKNKLKRHLLLARQGREDSEFFHYLKLLMSIPDGCCCLLLMAEMEM